MHTVSFSGCPCCGSPTGCCSDVPDTLYLTVSGCGGCARDLALVKSAGSDTWTTSYDCGAFNNVVNLRCEDTGDGLGLHWNLYFVTSSCTGEGGNVCFGPYPVSQLNCSPVHIRFTGVGGCCWGPGSSGSCTIDITE